MKDEQITKAFWAMLILLVCFVFFTFVLVWTKNHHEFRMTCIERGGDVIMGSTCNLPTNQKERTDETST